MFREPTDDYEKGLETLLENRCFRESVRLALPLFQGDIDVTEEGGWIYRENKELAKKRRGLLKIAKRFTGNVEAILKNISIDRVADIIAKVTGVGTGFIPVGRCTSDLLEEPQPEKPQPEADEWW